MKMLHSCSLILFSLHQLRKLHFFCKKNGQVLLAHPVFIYVSVTDVNKATGYKQSKAKGKVARPCQDCGLQGQCQKI